MCSSIFPRCTTLQSSDDVMPLAGRVPMCFYNCISTLVACPGFWLDDVLQPCSLISVPPMCSQAFYWRSPPPQLEDYADRGYPKDCPADSVLEPEAPAGAVPSPIDRAAAVAAA